MAQKGKEIVEASGMPPVAAKAAKYRSFEGLRERFRIGEEYDIILMREDESYLTLKPGCFVLSLDLLEAGLRLPMPEIAKELLRSWKVAPIQLTPNSWRTIFVFCIICRKKKIEATAEIFRNHFSLACSPQSGMGIVYVKHRTNRMRINFSPRLFNNKGWTGRLFSMGRQQGANIPEWDFPVRVVEPLRRADMPPFLIREAAAASQLLNTVGVNHAEGYLTEYKLVKCKLSRTWDDEEIADGRDQKEMANYAEMIPVSLCTIRLDGGGSAKGSAQQAKAATRGGAVKKALETATTAGATSLPQTKRKEKRKAAVVESQAGDRSSEEGVSDEPRAHKKRKMKKPMPRVVEGAAVVEEEAEEDFEPLLAQRSRQRTGTSEERAPATPTIDRSEAVMKMSAELGLIMGHTVQSVSWSGACEYQAGSFPRRRRRRVKGESGILALSSSSSSSWVGGSPSGTGQARAFSPSAFAAAGFACAWPNLFSIAVSPWRQSMRDLTPPACLTNFSTSSCGISF
ncbi:hypothetical protein Taro_041008 [Colocasia esculenta]|uniref:Transposase (putative) gypsy type domain-containing protein n=1 Tax=Colocasia esculenta TaxID=4460 RepID=A0A843WKD3_COLES|nr:hypothetical protein [Colocasia esculenta]